MLLFLLWHHSAILELTDVIILNNIIPANTGLRPCVDSMLAHRLRRWTNIETTHGLSPVFVWIIGLLLYGLSIKAFIS